jgi:hypothetical protein
LSLSYRLYLLDGAGKISTANWIDASSDEEALRHAREQCAPGKHELWHGRRLVAAIAKRDA